MRRGVWYTFGDVAVMPTRYGMILVDAADLRDVDKFSWHVRADTKFLYVRAWLDSHRASSLRGKAIYLHHFLMSPKDGELVDFKNGNGLDCRRENLRLADKSDDCCNRNVTTSNSGFLGVHFDKSRGKWLAQIKYRHGHTFIGRFDDLDAAVAARDEAAAAMHGEFASTLNERLRKKPPRSPRRRP